MLYYIISFYIILYFLIFLYYISFYYLILFHIIFYFWLYHIWLYDILLYYIFSYYIILCYFMLCCVMLCFACAYLHILSHKHKISYIIYIYIYLYYTYLYVYTLYIYIHIISYHFISYHSMYYTLQNIYIYIHTYIHKLSVLHADNKKVNNICGPDGTSVIHTYLAIVDSVPSTAHFRKLSSKKKCRGFWGGFLFGVCEFGSSTIQPSPFLGTPSRIGSPFCIFGQNWPLCQWIGWGENPQEKKGIYHQFFGFPVVFSTKPIQSINEGPLTTSHRLEPFANFCSRRRNQAFSGGIEHNIWMK